MVELLGFLAILGGQVYLLACSCQWLHYAANVVHGRVGSHHDEHESFDCRYWHCFRRPENHGRMLGNLGRPSCLMGLRPAMLGSSFVVGLLGSLC